jgi:metallophosphoesterase superfamily enzyme
LPCFLKGRLKFSDVTVIVMPAFSPLAGGTPVNVASREDFLSPLLKSPEVEVDEMAVYAVDEEIGILEFPALKKWKAVSLCL